MRTFILLGCIAVFVCGQELPLIAIGDWGTGGADQENVAAAMNEWAGENNPRFILTTGDNFYSDGIEGPDDPRWNDYWRNIYTGANINSLRWEVSVGNHDYRPSGSGYEWNQVEYTTHPNNVDGRWHLPLLNHSFYANSSIGQIHFIITDSQGIGILENDPDNMLRWLNNTLRTSTGVMKIVVAHHPIYSAGRHGPVNLALEDDVLPLLVEHNVDIWLCGHDHNHQHIRDVTPANDFLEEVITGGGGRGLYVPEELAWLFLQADGKEVTAFYLDHGFAGISTVGNELKIEFRDESNQLLYEIFKAPRTRSRTNVVVEPVPPPAAALAGRRALRGRKRPL